MNPFIRFLDSMTSQDPNLIGNIKSVYMESLVEGQETAYGAGLLFLCPSTKRVLLALRSKDEEDGNVWCSFGGKGEDGETPLKTAVREVYEEALVSPTQYRAVYEPFHINQNSPDFKFYNYLAITDSEFTPKLNDEHTQFGWFSPSELGSLKLHYGTEVLFSDPVKAKVINSYLSAGVIPT